MSLERDFLTPDCGKILSHRIRSCPILPFFATGSLNRIPLNRGVNDGDRQHQTVPLKSSQGPF